MIFSKYILVDPNELEERCMDGKLVIGMNKHREICTMQLSGNVLLLKDQVKMRKFFLDTSSILFIMIVVVFVKDQAMC